MNLFVRTPHFVSRYYKSYIWNIPGNERRIFLTFDDGPNPNTTPWILDILNKYNAKATFFCVGNNVRKYQGLFKSLITEGHEVGNHTYNHLNGWKTKRLDYIKDIEKANKYIRSDIFRPPYGKIKRISKKVVSENYKIIMWDVLSRDFDKSISDEKCLNNVINNAKPGSVVVFHDSVKAIDKLYYVLPRVLEYYSTLNFDFLPLKCSSNSFLKQV